MLVILLTLYLTAWFWTLQCNAIASLFN